MKQEMQGLAQEVSQGYAFVRIGEERDLFSSSSTMVRAGHDMGFTTIAVDMHFTSSRLDEREGVSTEGATGLNSTSNKQPSQKAREQSSLEETGSSREFVIERRTVESKDTAAFEQANCEVFKSRSLYDTHNTAKEEGGGVARDKSATMGTEVPVAAQDNKRQERKVEEDAADLEAKELMMLLQSEMKAAEDKVALESQIQELKAMLKAEKVARGWQDKYTNDLVNRFLDLKSQIGAGDRVPKTQTAVQTVCADCCSQSHSPLQVHDPELSDHFRTHWDKLVEKSKVHNFGTSAALLWNVTLKPQTTSSPILLHYNEQIPVTPLVAMLPMNVNVSSLPLGELQLQSSSNAHEFFWKVVNRLYTPHSILSANNPLNTPASLSGTTGCGASRGSITKSAQSRSSSPLPKSFYSRLASPPRAQTVNSDSLLTTRIGSARTR